jgi:hypothetical protein
MALSKRASDALDVLREEAQGNTSAASALASVERALQGNGPDEQDRDTPGRQQSREITKEGFDRRLGQPGRASGDGPPQAAKRGSNDDSGATDSNSGEASRETKLAFLRRRGTARGR